MKRRRAFLISFIALFAAGIFSFSAYAAQIIYVKGRVQVNPERSTVWNKAKAGMEVNIGDSIRTARHSEAQVLLDKNKKSFINVAEQTLVVINSTSADKINKLDLSYGNIFASVEKIKAGSVFEISTPSSIAGVRGTSWSVDSNSNRDEIAVYKDSVFVKAYDKAKKLISEIMVSEGFKTVVERFGPAGPLLPLGDRDKRSERNIKNRFLKNMKNLSDAGMDKIGDIADKTNRINEQLEEREEESGIGDREEEHQGEEFHEW